MTTLQQIVTSQAQKEVTANANFAAVSVAALFSQNISTTTGLTWGYYGGMILVGTTYTNISNGTVALTDNTTNYVEVDTSGTVHVVSSAFTAGRTPLYTVVTSSGQISGTPTDYRLFTIDGGSSGSSGVALETVQPAALFGNKPGATTGLTWGYYGGMVLVAGAYSPQADGTVSLTDNATNYIETDNTATIYTNTTSFTAGRIPLQIVVTVSGAITTVTDYRLFPLDPGADASISFTPGFTGFSVDPTVSASYQLIGKMCFVYIYTSAPGTSNATGFTMTGLPFAAGGITGAPMYVGSATDNGTATMCWGSVSGTELTLYKGASFSATSWTSSGDKGASLSFFYEINYIYTPVATNFGSGATMTKSADFTGDSDSKTLILSFWMDTAITTGSVIQVLGNVNGNFLLYIISDNAVLYGADSGSSQNLAVTAPTFPTSAWNHFLFAVNLATSYVKVYMNDVDVSASVFHSNTNINFSGSGWVLGGTGFAGCLSEVYFAPGQFLDITVTGNRRKFITAGLAPVSLGSDGSAPTGTAPLMYMRQNGGNIKVNSGTGGDFNSTSGTVNDCGSAP